MNAQQVEFEIAQDKSGAAVFAWILGSIAVWAGVIVWACN